MAGDGMAGEGSPDTPPFRPVDVLLCPVLVGRERHRSTLIERLDRAVAGAGGVVGLIGDAGVGKTRLCREVIDHAAARGARLLSGRGVPSSVPSPYRPLTEAFASAFRSGRPAASPELAGFEGHIRRLVPGWDAGGSSGADESPVLLGEAAVRLLRLLGGASGCLLVIEDIHWADAETLEVVDYLADALRGEPVLTVFTSRSSGATSVLLPRLQRRDPAALIAVDPLTAPEVDQVVSGCLSSDVPAGLSAFIATHSEGNPFLVEELLAGLVASGALSLVDGHWVTTDVLKPTVPFSLADSIRHRMSTLDPLARRVIAAAAVLGRQFDWELLPAVAELDGAAVVDGLRSGVTEQLIEVDGSDFKFRHALTREAVLDELLPPERRSLSIRARPAVERAHPGLPGPWCELVAELAEASGDEAAAANHLIECARRSLARGALASAEAAARRARRLGAGDRAITDDAEQVLAESLSLAGKPDEATALGVALADRLARGDAPADRRAALLVVLARAAIAAGNHAIATSIAEQARALIAGGQLDDAIKARLEAVAAHVALDQANLDEATSLALSAADRAAATGQPAVECEALEVLGRVGRLTSTGKGKEFFARAADIAERNGLTSWLIRSRQELALFEWTRGRIAPLQEVRDLAAHHGALVTVALMDLSLADFALSGFDRDRCRDAAQRCVAASRRYNLAMLPVAELWLAGAHGLFGEDDQMEAAAARALQRDADDPRILGDLWGRVRAANAIVHNDRDRLRECLDRQMDYARVAPVTTSIFPNRLLWALVHTIDDDDRGDAAREEIAAAHNLNVWPQFEAIREVLAAVAEGRDGDGATATARLEPASRELRDSGLAIGMVEFHHLLVCEAALRDGWGDPASWIRPAEAFFATNGYEAVARACRSVMAAAGAPVPRRGRGASAVPTALRALGVTGREHDVLQLVADGLTNREIGERLYLSPRTVERHLASLFNRTGVRTRAALGEFARSQSE
jgi:DNA-binding CsgD family transcriptional regulator